MNSCSELAPARAKRRAPRAVHVWPVCHCRRSSAIASAARQ
jgi:hypothetical protein